MAIIAICFSSFIGIMAASYHTMVLGGSFGQAVVTYFAASALSVVFVGLFAWAGSMIAHRSKPSPVSAEDELETWQDWMMEEEAELDALFEQSNRPPAEDFIAPKRKSA